VRNQFRHLAVCSIKIRRRLAVQKGGRQLIQNVEGHSLGGFTLGCSVQPGRREFGRQFLEFHSGTIVDLRSKAAYPEN